MKSPSRIKKILVANRGEIAVRIISTCRTMGMRTVAVCSDIDRDAPHVRLADESYLLGPSPARESYLNQSKILEIAVQAKADAIHPGYGFYRKTPASWNRWFPGGSHLSDPLPRRSAEWETRRPPASLRSPLEFLSFSARRTLCR